MVKVDTWGVAFKTALVLSAVAVVTNFERQYAFCNTAFEQEAEAESKKKLPVQTITIFNSLALVFDDRQELPSAIFTAYQLGGLLDQVGPPVTKSYRSPQAPLEGTAVPQMLRGEDWEAGRGVDVHLALAAVLGFEAGAEINARGPVGPPR